MCDREEVKRHEKLSEVLENLFYAAGSYLRLGEERRN